MIAITPNQILLLYTWFPLAVGIALMLLVARFYQKFSGERTYYGLYILPIVLFGGAAVRYASLNQIAGDALGDVIIGLAGLILISLSMYLFRLMTSGRK
jgi:hypothetical protein